MFVLLSMNISAVRTIKWSEKYVVSQSTNALHRSTIMFYRRLACKCLRCVLSAIKMFVAGGSLFEHCMRYCQVLCEFI